VRVWDLPTRLVHWLFVCGVLASWWTAETGRLEWHRWSGYALLGLLVFRIYWGFFGSSTARFGQFVRGPRAVREYMRGAWQVTAGHNPLGSWSVIALIGLLLVQVVLGLFAVDVDGIESGPLSMYVDFDTGRAAAELHETLFNVLMGVIVLHILAVLYYGLVRKQNLAGAMVTGSRSFPVAGVAPVSGFSWIRFLIGVVLAAAITWAISRAFQF
jgi:cytochrome b